MDLYEFPLSGLMNYCYVFQHSCSHLSIAPCILKSYIVVTCRDRKVVM